MKVKQFEGRNGAVKNQFLILDWGNGANGNFTKSETFQSYDSIIAKKITWGDTTEIILDEKYWDYSTTTGKYRNMFLGETKAETLAKIKSGVYQLANLN